MLLAPLAEFPPITFIASNRLLKSSVKKYPKDE